MSQNGNGNNIIHSGKMFYGPNLKNDKYEINKISCELGEIYYQTKLDDYGQKHVSKGENNLTNGLFITNDKINELISTGQIVKYSWLMQLVLTNRSDFVPQAKCGCQANKSNNYGANASTYYHNGIFVPLHLVDAHAVSKKRNEIVFRLPYGKKFRLKLRFNQENVNTPYNPENIKESIIERRNDKDNRFGVKEEYQDNDKPIHQGNFFVMNDGKDVTSHLNKFATCDKNGIIAAAAYLPTDFEKNDAVDAKDQTKTQIQKYWQENPSVDVFSMDEKNSLTTKKNRIWELICGCWLGDNFDHPGGTDKPWEYTASTKKYTLQGKRDTPPKISKFKLELDPANLDLQVIDSPANPVEQQRLNELVADFKQKYLDFTKDKVAETNSNIQKLLNRESDNLFETKNVADKVNEKIAFLAPIFRTGYSNPNIRSYINGTTPEEVRVFIDSEGYMYYRKYDRAKSECVGEMKPSTNKPVLFCELDAAGDKVRTSLITHVGVSNYVCVNGNKVITSGNTVTDVQSIFNNAQIQNFLKEFKDKAKSGQLHKLFKSDSGQSPAEQLGIAFGNNIKLESGSLVPGRVRTVSVCDYSPVAGGIGNFKLKTGEVITPNNEKEAADIFDKEDAEEIKKEIENDKTNVLSTGELFDFCASQIDAVAQNQQKQHADPYKEKAQEYFRNINLFFPKRKHTPYFSANLERKLKQINNTSGFAKTSDRGRF